MAFSLFVFNPALERIGEVRGIMSLQWLTSYQETGEAKLVCGSNEANIQILQNGNLLQNTDDPLQLALIESVTIDDEAKSANITVRARLTSCRLDDRVVMYTQSYTDAEPGILNIVSSNLRGLPMLVSQPHGYDIKITGQVSWGSVLDAITSISESSGLGFRVLFDQKNGKETFEVYKGIDRTSPGSDDYVGFFGDDARNIVSVHVQYDRSEYKNVAIVCGEGEGADRMVEEADLSGGEERFELFVDARDLTKKTRKEKPDGTTEDVALTDEEYRKILHDRGVSALEKLKSGTKIKAQLAQTVLIFGRDYGLGDILPLRINKYGIRIHVRVASVRRVYEKTGSLDAVLEVVG